MLRSPTTAGLAAVLLSALPLSAQVAWPQFRGTQASGVSDDRPLPATFDLETSENIAWRTDVPGIAHASPIVAGDRVFVATAVPTAGDSELKIGLYGAGDSADDLVEHLFQLWCLDLSTGRPLWVRTAHRGVPQFARHTKATHANSTPATDGERVVVVFGSEGMFCYSTDGELEWSTSLGELDVGPHNGDDLEWGYASSPVIADGKVLIQADVKKDPRLAAYDLATGDVVWQTPRDDTTSWATPTVVGSGDDAIVLVNGCKHMGAYSLADGSEIWHMAGGGGLPIPAPLAVGDLWIFTSNHRPLVVGHPIKPVFAVRPDARGELGVPSAEEPGDHVAWMRDRVGNYIQTPIHYRGLLYLCKGNGVVHVLDPTNGESVGNRHRIGDGATGFSASPVAGDGKVYFTAETGEVIVLDVDAGFEALHRSQLGTTCLATPAIADGHLLFRTTEGVIAVRADAEQTR